MNSKAILAAVISLFLLDASLPAAGPKPPKPPKEKHESRFHGSIVLVATTNAPTNATGVAEFKTEEKKEHVKSKIKIKTHGLEAGDYLLSAVQRSDSNSVALGSITVKDDGKGKTDDKDVDLPADLDIRDIAQIVVSDADTNGTNAVLVGDFTNPGERSRLDFKAKVNAEPGPAAPDASGKASIRSILNHAGLKEQFKLMGKHLPPDTTFDIFVDGTNVGQVTSTERGTVAVRGLPGVSLLTVRAVELKDAGGSVALSAEF